ncbi:hypothetical protein A3K29_04310 [Candidatus Collierbacteria bacterium RIFOXYB2_FULL_46_14]|uniref:Prepilin-type N-terminal cleavage/methylation domain-containing protein n=1 Tax=Candidatus Collierbacteria bacterium GW2011_GWA2_46_26 TaxID=1618381 RepID=A0A0G1PL29_9BACT|nr:MAG: hypothetical protein UW29_C0002G0042 [Candidatus Collierbacteria bacterium GW2011_GWC2_44_13]KKU33519.1 MAG: hypothetical protein UX47_C0003G0042 [Candidatus Collierbacteria bacterium GW2011_GWA2_46_26]OGD73324.1 MAG: hypothetical protein A3K29_04310 [Candidatus Collierbacteria bacterium RIFOXYB2_FULL_46_14]OGD76366.1 MAG: hypothetical protein A3K43_04310 [Candidatus Collierbacteria bacterium RIFOXYA2_FULL_46_20]OGD77702.1 MAG: hypothetical protein A3K39_04310 [Candidatus Collierbacteri
MKRSVKTTGFTLIELMIVMAMIVLMAGGSIAAYLRFNTNQQIVNDARQLIAELSKARSSAATLQYPLGCTGLTGINVRSTVIDSNLVGLESTTLCGSGNVIGSPIQILKTSLFDVVFDITFLPGSGYLSTGADQTIVIKDINNPTVTKMVTVGTYSDIYEN